MEWPQSLVREIAARRCIFFIGAGISASSVDGNGNRPKTWSEFLEDAANLVLEVGKKSIIKDLIKNNNHLLALQGIRDECNAGDYRRLLDNNFNNPGFIPSSLHEHILKLDSRIVITTNFDKLYEKLCNSSNPQAGAFKVINYYSDDLCDELRSDTRLIIKAHGSIDEISKMIFTRAEYHEAKRNNPHFYEVLKALFLTNTVVFLGCGLQDPDVLLLLEDVKIASRSSRPHYVVTKHGSQPEPVISDWKKTYNIESLEFGPDFVNLSEDLERLVDLVINERASTGLS